MFTDNESDDADDIDVREGQRATFPYTMGVATGLLLLSGYIAVSGSVPEWGGALFIVPGVIFIVISFLWALDITRVDVFRWIGRRVRLRRMFRRFPWLKDRM